MDCEDCDIKDKLIARLYRQNQELQDEVFDFRERCQRAALEIIRIGGPLNDNSLKYSKAQLVPFQRILDQVSP